MRTATKRLYEGMFLVDSALAASDWDGVIGAIERVLSRASAEIVSLRKWDERKLEYEIKRKSRGTYILTYFNVDSDKIGGIERDVQLSEQILRVLILRGDHVTQEMMDQDTPAMLAEKQAEQEAAEQAERAAAAEAEAVTKAAEAAEAPETPETSETSDAPDESNDNVETDSGNEGSDDSADNGDEDKS